jgi:hypothetical protein
MRHLYELAYMLLTLGVDAIRVLRLGLRSPAALTAENLFLRKQLALYQARHVKPKRATNATRFTLVWLSRWFDWQPALAIVQPETFSRWCRQGGGLWWCWKSQPGRPPIPMELQGLIRQMARDNLTWGQRRIANELRLKLGLQVSPRTVRKYTPRHLGRAPGQHMPSQRWRTFLRNHARALIVNSVSGVQAWSEWIRRHLPWWKGHSIASEWQGSVQIDTMFLSLLHETVGVPTACSPDIVDVINVDERSPPDGRPPSAHDPRTAVRATPADTLDVCPVVAARYGWHRASPHVPSAAPLSKDGIRGIPWRRAAGQSGQTE